MRQAPAVPQNTSAFADQPRRAFLTRLGVAAGAAVLGTGLPGCETVELHSDPPKKGATLSFDLAAPAFQELATVGNAVAIEVGGNKGLLIRSSADKFIAVSSVCTHQGCPLSWDQTSKAIKCFCHGAAFGPDGKVANKPSDGSAIANLAVWSVTFDPTSGKGTVTT